MGQWMSGLNDGICACMQDDAESLMDAARCGNVEKVARKLDKGVPVNSTNKVSAWHGHGGCTVPWGGM